MPDGDRRGGIGGSSRGEMREGKRSGGFVKAVARMENKETKSKAPTKTTHN